MPPIEQPRSGSGRFFRFLGEATARERRFLSNEILQVRGLMDLLMKPRNGERWTPEEKRELKAHLRRLTSVSPYLVVVLVLPGGMLILPVLAWWLDRRRSGNRPGPPVPR
jgi:hypothetical protein